MSEFTSAVRLLFDTRAGPWVRFYEPGGALEYRFRVFSDAVSEISPPPGRVLDFGCGTGHIGGRLTELGYTVDGCDLSSAMLEEGRRIFGERMALQLLDPSWSALPFEDARFDVVIASSVLEYVENLSIVLSEIARVVRIGGVLAVTVPNMRHPRRWLERAMAIALRLPALSAIAALIPRLALHARYLRTSKNRFSTEEWHARFASAGLTVHSARPAGPMLDLYTLERR